MEKLKMHSPNFAEENIAKLTALFPGCVTETEETTKDANGREKVVLKKAIDWDLLKQELSNYIVEGPQERYQLNWPGKREALLTANAPIAKTLRPCREESVDFDSTENLFIEGDNLDALKLLQETYLGKVKMIYIDPPYNTGKDFIYADNFAESSEEYLLNSGQKDEDGNRLVANTDSNGRFHSDWLSMMYPRLKLARNLLRDDGVIFISIDDNEQANLKRMCDEIFGEENFVSNIIWNSTKSVTNSALISVSHTHNLLYFKNIDYYTKHREKFRLPESGKGFTNPDNDPRGVWKADPFQVGGWRPNQQYEITNPNTGKIYTPNPNCSWKNDYEKYLELEKDGRIFFGIAGAGAPQRKRFLFEAKDRGIVSKTLWDDIETTTNGTQLVKELFDGRTLFTNPKPITLIQRMLQLATEKNDIILDFFAGSSTTAHAVMQLNAEDKGNRKFIMVQLPEPCDEKSEAFKAGYKTIAEISKERIRRAGAKIKEELTAKDAKDNKKENDFFRDFRAFRGSKELDTGFRVLKVDSSNMLDVYYTPDAVEQNKLSLSTDNIKDDRTSEDLLFQVLLDWGVDLTLPITKEIITTESTKNKVYFVDKNTLAACFEKDGKITEDFCKTLARRQPLRVVFRDSGFKDDSVKINVEQIFKLMSPHTDVKTI